MNPSMGLGGGYPAADAPQRRGSGKNGGLSEVALLREFGGAHEVAVDFAGRFPAFVDRVHDQ